MQVLSETETALLYGLLNTDSLIIAFISPLNMHALKTRPANDATQSLTMLPQQVSPQPPLRQPYSGTATNFKPRDRLKLPPSAPAASQVSDDKIRCLADISRVGQVRKKDDVAPGTDIVSIVANDKLS